MRFHKTSLRKVGFALAFTTFLVYSGNTQSLELGLFAGKSSYLGEMQFEYYEPNHSNSALGGFATLNFNKWIGLKTEYITSQISGSDNNLVNPDLKNRNLSFQTDLNEVSTKLQISIATFGKLANKPLARTYIFGGVGLLRFNPKAKHGGQMIELQKLGTEGQNINSEMSPYDLTEMVIPFGMGFQFNLSNRLSIAGELKFRHVKTDYLDDVSSMYPDIEVLRQDDPLAAELSFRTPEVIENYEHNPAGELRGDDRKYDTYFFVGGNVSYKIIKPKKAGKLPTFYDDPIK